MESPSFILVVDRSISIGGAVIRNRHHLHPIAVFQRFLTSFRLSLAGEVPRHCDEGSQPFTNRFSTGPPSTVVPERAAICAPSAWSSHLGAIPLHRLAPCSLNGAPVCPHRHPEAIIRALDKKSFHIRDSSGITSTIQAQGKSKKSSSKKSTSSNRRSLSCVVAPAVPFGQSGRAMGRPAITAPRKHARP